eukprot:5999500-Prymnesium_polylepis.1
MAPPVLTKKPPPPAKPSGGGAPPAKAGAAGGSSSASDAEPRSSGAKEQVGATGWYRDIKRAPQHAAFARERQALMINKPNTHCNPHPHCRRLEIPTSFQPYDPAVPNEYEDWLREEAARKKAAELERQLQLKQEKASKAFSTLAAGVVPPADDPDPKRQRIAPAGPPPPPGPAAAGGEGDGEGDPGLSMLQKMGWSEGSGLGKSGQGMKTPLMAKKMDGATGVI